MAEAKKPDPVREVDRELFNPVKQTINGTPTFVRNPIDRLDKVFNFHSAQYMLIGSNTGVGKTSLLDHFILSIIQDYPENLHFEVLYYSMERKKRFKFAKWLSWKIKDAEGLRVSSDSILNRNGKLTQAKFDHIKNKYGDWLDKTMEFIDLREGPRTVAQIEYDIKRWAKRIGTRYHTTDTHLLKNDKIIKTLDPEQFVMTKYGKRLFVRLTVKDKQYTLYQNDSVYVTDKPTVAFILIDHIGKVKVEGTKKETLDRLDEVLSTARDLYGFSPIAVSQFNRSVGATDRQKLHKGDLSPTMEDFKDTGNLTESADLVISLFDPARYKSWDSKGEYKGYNIRDNTVTPLGQQRARSLHVIKNSFGYDNATMLLRFTGESMYFESMPPANDIVAMTRIYKEISEGK